MSKKSGFGKFLKVSIGAAAVVAGALAVQKVSKEIKADMKDDRFISPEGDNVVTLSCGSSATAKGLTWVKLCATSSTNSDTCKLAVLAKNGTEFLSGQWIDNENFKLLVGNGNRKQCCDVSFGSDKISARYYLAK